jgi:hypothetical protein
MRLARAAVLAALVAVPAWALEAPQWPPPEATAARMHELQQAIIARDSTAAQREAAREELAELLKSPAGQLRGRTPDEKPRPARAAVTDPVATPIVPVAPAPATPQTGVARLEVIEPPKPLVNPRSGSVAVPIAPAPSLAAPAPSPGFAIDPRNGAVLHGSGAGFVDPRTGQFTPR